MRLIDADKLADKLEKEGWALYRNYKDSPTTYLYETKKIDSIPTIDAVEVVQCKDCCYWNGILCTENALCSAHDNVYAVTPRDGFCHKGRRSE